MACEMHLKSRMYPTRPLFYAPLTVICVLAACGGTLVADADETIAPDGDSDADSDGDGDTDGDGDGDGDADGDSDAARDGDIEFAIDGPAFLHANLWSVWWNDRTRCGAEVAFLEICLQRGEVDCSLYQQAVEACDPWNTVYGQIGPAQQGTENCSRGRYPDVGGCDTTRYDWELLRFWWYGAEWSGNWPTATIKIFPGGTTDPMTFLGTGLVAFSNLPGTSQAAMAGISNHGLSEWGCTMPGQMSGDAAYQTPFGGFAWIEVPTDAPVSVVAMTTTNFGDSAFQGCDRGDPTQEPWITDAPGAILGCVYVEDYHFQPGRHYFWEYGLIRELPSPSPPQQLIDGLAIPGIGLNITTREGCTH